MKEVDFRDDDGEALLLLLRIAHHQYNDIPTTLAYKTLLNVAVLCDCYSYVELVEPWLSQWLSDEQKSSKEAEHENWLFIAWVFGRDKVFSDLAAKMVLRLRQMTTANASHQLAQRLRLIAFNMSNPAIICKKGQEES